VCIATKINGFTKGAWIKVKEKNAAYFHWCSTFCVLSRKISAEQKKKPPAPLTVPLTTVIQVESNKK
jgi:hypothetical protein